MGLDSDNRPYFLSFTNCADEKWISIGNIIVDTSTAPMSHHSVFIQSSFWAPLFNPRILNYRVDATFDENGGKNNREAFEENYGYRGKDLIKDLGNGNGPRVVENKDRNYGPVRFYYTYPGAYQRGENQNDFE
ncbi:hypothetical protein NE865_03358 [Phthorimaea operculella]|nr:hypothetical protein NE865_03358 [Phthorimaea operculella]